MDRIHKFLPKLSTKPRERVIAAIAAITNNHLEGMDVKPLKGKKGWFRCRLGDIRIIFVRTQSHTNVVVEVDFRGKVYRRF